MATKLIGLIKLVDAAAFDEYRSKVGVTVEKYGGVITDRRTLVHSYWNELNCGAFDAFVELEFPTLADASRWAASADYRQLLEVRKQAMQLTLFALH
ncbi:DUF1330 domain-containing protein [Candidatus Accumulibacter sp. ACC003]|uniref:DUF1330 domain-containing protein n=1 Tax=Candidatus Accumulibacter sp. ACC003 TaxID=2823334 RepID=UPI0025BC3C02|nr:DUF1330 domain-containing protein [Candidatus Accumulibacter sp. ACC003]